MATSHYGRTLTLFWNDSNVVGRWNDGAHLPPVPAPDPEGDVDWVVGLIEGYRREFPGARVRATNRESWREPVGGRARAARFRALADYPVALPEGSELHPLHFHLDGGDAKECWHWCAEVVHARAAFDVAG
ncbi:MULTISPECIES: hypothetical protein [Actinosynnema]|uniref:hypothetical protein n=1 Tax=Actinosynnema TaxID=40566 RepID=UPI0020A5D0B6|nr:hypothetical protein [Actinosynnema pretiosum]MCP2093945.1 hypothetical protein [Actinosynnema pretiosum]